MQSWKENIFLDCHLRIECGHEEKKIVYGTRRTILVYPDQDLSTQLIQLLML
jgi:hypothetical protein